MKLQSKDYVDEVYYIYPGVDKTIEYHDLPLDLMKVKLSKRDGKGSKLRV